MSLVEGDRDKGGKERKAAKGAAKQALAAAGLAGLEAGASVKGVVKRVEKFGLFVALDDYPVVCQADRAAALNAWSSGGHWAHARKGTGKDHFTA